MTWPNVAYSQIAGVGTTIIDAHAHLGPGLRNHGEGSCEFSAITAQELVAALDRAGIHKAIIFAPLYEGGEFIDPDYRRGNLAIYEAVRQAPERLIGYGRVCPNLQNDAIREWRRAAHLDPRLARRGDRYRIAVAAEPDRDPKI